MDIVVELSKEIKVQITDRDLTPRSRNYIDKLISIKLKQLVEENENETGATE